MSRLRCAFALALALAPFVALAGDVPVARRIDDQIAVILPSSLLSKEIIQERLQSGLTTTFLVDAKFGGAARQARIEVRYDPWDEVYLARVVDGSGRSDLLRVGDLQALRAWWTAQPLRLFSVARGEPGRVMVGLRVLPFSPSEEQETRDWIGEAAGLTSRGASEAADISKEDNTRNAPGSGGIIDALIATSIQARPVLTYRWTIGLSP
ncbi:MAG: hypothetical protein WBX15_17345 [Thermoanaerobaculia bacterium]